MLDIRIYTQYFHPERYLHRTCTLYGKLQYGSYRYVVDSLLHITLHEDIPFTTQHEYTVMTFTVITYVYIVLVRLCA
jgi:KaiC/GvpD/RAD55 family RecA-like ATPase